MMANGLRSHESWTGTGGEIAENSGRTKNESAARFLPHIGAKQSPYTQNTHV
jgi:hypothetical protein